MSVLFVAGAGTDIGKTYVSALVCRQLRAAGRQALALKPVASGVPALDDVDFASSDTARLLEAQGLPCSPANVEACSPWRFTAPLSPDMAAAAEERTLGLDALLTWCRGRIAAAPTGATVLIEGVGGVMSPMASDALNIDVMQGLGCPAILVGGSYLGGISHLLTALEVLRARRVRVKALVVNETEGSTVPLSETIACIQRYAGDVSIASLDRNADVILEISLLFND
jgi:dethiobiotin synthetase